MIDILDRIANRLAEISPETNVYVENQRSGFNVPAFYVNRVSTEINPRLNGIQDRHFNFQIVYFPNPDNPNVDMNRMEDLLSDNFLELEEFATIRNREFNTDTEEQTLSMQFEIWLNMMPEEFKQKQEVIKLGKVGLKDRNNNQNS